MDTEQLSATLLELEHRGWQSLCDGTGADFYGRIMTDDAVMVLANGAVMDRSHVVEALEGSPTWAGYDLTDERVVTIGPDAAALVYTGSAHRDGSQPSVVATMSSVYVRTTDGWRLAVYQQTPAPGDG